MPTRQYIVRNASHAARATSAQVHPLNPRARRNSYSLGDAAGLARVGAHINIVAPGDETTEAHRHAFCDEFVYILSGKATVTLDGEEFEARAGDFVGFPAGGPAHAMKNTGSADLVYLVGGNRPDFDVTDYPRAGKRMYLVAGADGRRQDYVNAADIRGAAAAREKE